MEENTLYITVNEIREKYLPVSIKKIRKIVKDHCRVKRNGNRILVDRKEFLDFLNNPENKL